MIGDCITIIMLALLLWRELLGSACPAGSRALLWAREGELQRTPAAAELARARQLGDRAARQQP